MKSVLELFPLASKDTITLNPTQPPNQPDKTRSRHTQTFRNGIPEPYETPNRSEIPDSEPQHHQTPALDGADAGETKSIQRTRIRFVGYRVRPLDPDNFAGGCKDLLDGLRHAQLILGDEPWQIIFETAQEKVKTYAEERTEIEIEIP